MRSIRIPLALLLAGTIVGCSVALSLDDYEKVCEDAGCRACITTTDCGEPPLCTVWTCEANVCQQRPAEARSPCPLGVCDGAGECVGCINADDCGESTECGQWICGARICTRTFTAAGTPLSMQPNDCQTSQCDGKGNTSTVFDLQGTACATNGGKVCDGTGSCVECMSNADCTAPGSFCDVPSQTCFRCNDSQKNGDETDTDCGGQYCAKCAPGKACTKGGDCVSNFCVDGVCCNSSCTEPCKACNLIGSVGLCDAIPKYGEDLSYGNGETCLHANNLACTGLGSCESTLGSPCLVNGDCASIHCADPDENGQKTCVKGPGDPCIQPVECYNNMCASGICPP
ncbi:hypothetical protein [Polyangium mundeleinium]|uniref:Tryptophan synthase alpha chain n=1 Tax=Polyangium mundeleinium TaxID=2995306 RepID=A0ABT5EZV4_9BACT|nr:hypothetical protein [Polyangium mundeleinium]MDC0746894.1 hypothetical protein [Polyangium mundeleinium]